jgi:hypothetical protein
LGDPLGGTPAYAFCVYDQTAGVPALKMGINIAAGGTCGTKPCWKAVSDKGWSYSNRSGSSGGITKVKFKGGDAGKPNLQVAAKGASLLMPPVSGGELFDQDSTVIEQLHSSEPAACWSSSFVIAGTKRNDGGQFTAKNP